MGGKTVFYRTLEEKGISYIKDIMNDEGIILTLEEINEKYKTKIDFLTYFGLKRAITDYFKKRDFTLCKQNNILATPVLPFNISKINRSKGSRLYYQALCDFQFNKTNGQLQWERVLNKKLEQKEWVDINLMANRCTQSVNLKWFQYKIVQNILTTNIFLKKIGYIDSSLCSLCKEEPESILHVLCDCTYSNRVWQELSRWLGIINEGDIQFTAEKILFGFSGRNNNPLNIVCLIVKQNIYKMNRKALKPNFKAIQNDIISYYQACRYISHINDERPKFYAFWSSFHTLFNQ